MNLDEMLYNSHVCYHKHRNSIKGLTIPGLESRQRMFLYEQTVVCPGKKIIGLHLSHLQTPCFACFNCVFSFTTQDQACTLI